MAGMQHPQESPAIQVTDLRVTLGGQPILQDITFDVPAGSITGLLGPNGAGKTTLIRSIVGRQRLGGGAVSIFGMPTATPAARRLMGYMTQGLSVYGDLTVRQNVRYFAAMTGRSKQQADDVITEVELNEKADTLVNSLSGGQKSRVSLAIALLGHPKLLVLDEPTVGLDPVLRKRLWQLFEALAAKGSTLLVSSHVMDEADHCQNLLLVRGGKLLAHDTPAALMERTHTDSVEDSFIQLVGGKL